MEGDEQIGVNIARRVLEKPTCQVAENAGVVGSIVVDCIHRDGKTKGYGYNALTGVYEGLEKASIVDPAKMSPYTLENAASTAGFVLTTEAKKHPTSSAEINERHM